MMQQHKIQVEKTAHYFRFNEPSPTIRQLWIVCHGYAQRADEFLESLGPLHRPEILVLAPEGMHNFYRKGFEGDVVATWMTKRNRLDEIKDFSNFLQQLLEKYTVQLKSDVEISLLGFSQGCATVCRWALAKKPHFHNLLLWGGLPPEDLDYFAEKDYFADKSLFLLFGSNDPFLKKEHFDRLHELEKTHQLDFKEQSYEGGHEVPPTALLEFLKNLK